MNYSYPINQDIKTTCLSALMSIDFNVLHQGIKGQYSILVFYLSNIREGEIINE